MQASPALQRLVEAVAAHWPDHTDFLRKSLAGHPPRELEDLEALAGEILAIHEQPQRLAESYRWMCHQFLEEELYFRRNQEYRCRSFAQAFREVYSNPPFMQKYMEGLLLSQLFWQNHARAFLYFRRQFLPRLPERYDYLEIGPGHGLFLACAARDPRSGTVSAWDVSPESLQHTRACLRKLGTGLRVQLDLRDVLADEEDGATFDAISISEVLEHLDDPAFALRKLRQRLKPDGRAFINVPINSPAPDHVFLLRRVEEASQLVLSNGYRVEELVPVPMTGYTLERAQRASATISCLMVARRA